MSANIKASTDGTQAIIGVAGVDQMTVSNAGVVTANSFVGSASSATALATGSTTARTLATRFADVVNVKDFGAVGDGVADDTAAIQAALNTGKAVYVTKGNYVLNNMITVQNGQMLFGDSPTQSVFEIKTSTVNMSALGIVKLGTGTSSSQQEPAGRIENIGINSNIDTTISVRANVPNLPPLIYADNAPRGYINNIKLSGAWDGIKLTNNCGGFFIGRVEIGALNIGINIPGYSADFIMCDDWHFWPFGISGNLYNNVYLDAQTTACYFGDIDGLNIGKISIFNSKIILAGTGTILSANIGILQLDGSKACLISNGRNFQIGQCYGTGADGSLNPKIEVNGGRLFIGNMWYVGYHFNDVIKVTSGIFQLNSGFVNNLNPNTSMINVSGGLTQINNVRLEMPNIARTVAYVKQTGGILQLKECDGSGFSHEIVNFSQDNVGNIVEGDYLQPSFIILPTTIYNGKYQIETAFSATITPDIVGDWSVVYGVREGRMRIDKDWADFWLRFEFTPTFTTSSGILRISNLPYQVQSPSEIGINFFEGINFAAGRTAISGRFQSGKTIELFESGTAVPLDPANLTSGTKVTLLFSGRIRN